MLRTSTLGPTPPRHTLLQPYSVGFKHLAPPQLDRKWD